MREDYNEAFKLTIGLEGKPSNDPRVIEECLWDALRRESALLCKVPTEKQSHGKRICCVPDCTRPVYNSALYCNAHYIRQKNGKDLSIPIRNRKVENNMCVDCGIGLTQHGCGLGRCLKHFKRYRAKILKEALVRVMGGKCNKCEGVYASYVYDFHHNGDKDIGIGNMFGLASLKRIAMEVSKCDMLCANCHREVTYAREL